jgi:sulfur carrier protein ThiS
VDAAIHLKIIFSPVFRTYFHCHERSMIMEKEKPTVIDLLRQLSTETAGKIDLLIFEKDAAFISAGLMVQVNDRVYTGTMLNQHPVPLEDQDVVSLLYYISGG